MNWLNFSYGMRSICQSLFSWNFVTSFCDFSLYIIIVYSFGTEGRAGHPSKEIPPQHQVFPLIVFKGTDVKDLKVEENPPVVNWLLLK